MFDFPDGGPRRSIHTLVMALQRFCSTLFYMLGAGGDLFLCTSKKANVEFALEIILDWCGVCLELPLLLLYCFLTIFNTHFRLITHLISLKPYL